MIGWAAFINWLLVSGLGYVAIWNSIWRTVISRTGLLTLHTIGVVALYIVLGRLVLDIRGPGWATYEYLLWPLVVLVTSVPHA